MATVVPAEATAVSTSSVRWSRIEPAVAAYWFVGLLDKFAVGIIVTTKPFLAEMSLNNSYVLIGLLTSVVVFSQAVGTFLFGFVTDKWGPRRCALIGESARLISTIIFALAPNLLVLLFARALLGLGEGHCWPVANALNARWFPLRERARGRSFWLGASAFGPGVSGFLVGTLLQLSSWRGAFWVLALISAAVFLMVYFWIQNDPAKDPRVSPAELALIQQKSELDVKVAAGTSGSKLRDPDYWLAVFATMGVSVGVWAWAAWLPSYFSHVKHLNLNATKNYLLLAYTVGFLANVGLSRLIDRTQRRGLMGSIFFVVLGLLIFTVGFVPSAPSILLLVCVIALHYGTAQPVAQGFIDRISLPKRMGLETGILNGIGNIAAAVGPMLMGFLIGVAHGGYQYAFLFLVGVCLMSACASALLMKRGY